ncbi:hypothetical protein PLICRDRAFT_34963 [Plicaturopsis crispa FD-325 SS-3]|nr:hypothetical protein PLICRDRAFT_34963 [Plicaturopsis crispa FD-325 SS-3]
MDINRFSPDFGFVPMNERTPSSAVHQSCWRTLKDDSTSGGARPLTIFRAAAVVIWHHLFGPSPFSVARIFASFNHTPVHVTDLSGKKTVSGIIGGTRIKVDRDDSSP